MFDYELDLLIKYDCPSDSIDDDGSPPNASRELLTAALLAIGDGDGDDRHSKDSAAFRYVRYGVSCLRAFVQLNFVGPPPDDEDVVADVRRRRVPHDLTDSDALNGLALGGEPAYALCEAPSLLYIAKLIFVDAGRGGGGGGVGGLKAVCPSISWWACRTCGIWQRLFADRRPELRDILFEEFAFLDDLVSAASVPMELKAVYAIEKCRAYGFYYESEKAETALRQALAFANLDNVRLTGVLGRKTKFQLKDVAQLSLENSETADEGYDLPRAEFPVDCALNDDTLLNTPQFHTAIARKPFTPIQECALIALLENLERQHFSGDVLQCEIEKAYLDRLLHHPVTYVGKYVCLLRRCALEMDEPRRIERALGQSEQLVKDFQTRRPSSSNNLSSSLAPAQDRLRYAFSVGAPPIWEVRKTEATLLMKLGCTSEALRVFLDLQLWDEVVDCYRRLGMMDRAEAIIREQLAKKETPHLLCLLGDIRNEESWYVKAWDASGKRLAKAQSSLGMVYFVRKKYDEAVAAFELALAIFPLDLKSWYSLGYCAMQTKNYQRAAEAYRRCVTIDGDSFEAWNNLAACYVYLGDKYRAFQILNEAIKCNYENWKVWENHVHMGVDTGHFQEALTGINRLVDLKGRYDDIQVLEILVRVATTQSAAPQSSKSDVDRHDADGKPPDIDDAFVSNLCTLFGRLTAAVVDNAPLWRLYADLRRPTTEDAKTMMGDWERYSSILQRAHQTAVRKTGWQNNDEEADKVADYALRLAESQLKLSGLIEASSSSATERPKQLAASARLTLRGVLANLSSVNSENSERQDRIDRLRGLLESIENI